MLWPINLINLPRRGPRPVLPPETRLTVKILDDYGIPTKNEVQRQPELISRYNYANNQASQRGQAREYGYQPRPAPIERAYAPQQQQSPTIVVVQAAAPVLVQQRQQAQGQWGMGIRRLLCMGMLTRRRLTVGITGLIRVDRSWFRKVSGLISEPLLLFRTLDGGLKARDGLRLFIIYSRWRDTVFIKQSETKVRSPF